MSMLTSGDIHSTLVLLERVQLQASEAEAFVLLRKRLLAYGQHLQEAETQNTAVETYSAD